MLKYNLIYTSPDNHDYLWNGTGFDKLKSADREPLLFSGKTVKEDELTETLKKCKAAATKLFPEDKDTIIKSVEVAVP